MTKNPDKPITKLRYYPTWGAAIHLMVLYIFIGALFEFPLSIWDYHHDTMLSDDPWIKIPLLFGAMLFILIYGFLKTGDIFRNVFALKWFNPLVLIPLITLIAGVQFFLGYMNFWVQQLIPVPSWMMELFERVINPDTPLIPDLIKVVVIAPVFEEMLFRGIILYGLERNYKPWIAIFVSALLFALFHLNPWQFPATFLLGLVLALMRIRTKSFIPCILGHSIHNFLVFLAVTYEEKYFAIEQIKLGVKTNNLLWGTVIISSLILIFFITMNRKRNLKRY